MFVPIFSGIIFCVWMMSAALYWSVDSVAATGRDKRIKTNQHNLVFLVTVIRYINLEGVRSFTA